MAEKNVQTEPGQGQEDERRPYPVAVIDIGTSSIRMAIAEIEAGGGVRRLDSVKQSVGLGRDAFTAGRIRRSTVEDCVTVLRSFQRVMREYGVTEPDQIRAVATSAVRDAQNRDDVLSRLYIATGIRVESIDEAEANRLTYLGVQPVLKANPVLDRARTLVVEAGGGSTELLLIRRGVVGFAYAARLGSLRMREMLEGFGAPRARLRDLMEKQVARTVDQMLDSLPHGAAPRMVALGGDAGFAVSQLAEGVEGPFARLPLPALETLTSRLLDMSVDDLVRTYHLTYHEADTLGPALLVYVRLAKAIKADHILVSGATMRDGLLVEMATRGRWTDAYRKQILRSAYDLGKKYGWDKAHEEHVAGLCRVLYQALQDEHRLPARYADLLNIAALLHEIGLFVSNRGHHKHSMYLILNSNLFGLGRRDLMTVALVARYHRQAEPRPGHYGYRQLDDEGRIIVAKLASILRVADALDRAHSGRVRDIRCTLGDGQLSIGVPGVADLSLEELALSEKGGLFEKVYGMRIVLNKRG
jgi:exopolyphosphatase/guanosine-5'-triphosphate,3'-diphosphate pyrophosphatase